MKIFEGYGLTEGACVSSVNPPGGERLAGSIGLPIPYQRIAAVILDGEGRFQRVADVDAGRTIAERAAIPKRIKISSSLSTTAVGKLFKSALVRT